MPESQRIAPDLEFCIQNAQYRMLATYMPHMYVLNIVCTLLVAAMLSHFAPPERVFPILTVVLAIAIHRLVYWLNPRLPETESLESIARTVKQAPYYGFVYFALLTYWTIDATSYGTESHLAVSCLYVGLASLCAISFNTHLPRCVYAVLLGGPLPLIGYLMFVGTENALIIAALLGSNALILVISVNKQHRDFVAAVRMKLAAEAAREDAENARRDVVHLANTDPLTGLANRRALVDAIAKHVAQADTFVLGLIDLDGFKPVNDLHGHTTSDAVLITVAKRLRLALSPDTLVARLGGDEFGFILVNPPERPDLLNGIAQLTIDAIGQPIQIDDGGHAHISACCGLARCPNAAGGTSDFLQQADEALYAAKRLSRGSVVLYDKELESQQTRKFLVETRLRAAIADKTLQLAFQPIRELRTDRISSYEALARWNDTVLGQVSPGEFIPLAEQAGFVSALSDVLFEQALEEAAHWPRDVLLSFNLSPIQIHDPQFALRTLATLSRHQIPPDRLILEVTETALLKDIERAATVIEQLRGAGIKIALDDFGVGYAGFSYLDRLTIDKLKIDRSFVRGMTESRRKHQIVKSIVEMCHSLDITCVAEGIESDDELQLLKAIGCDSGQGYLLGHPAAPPSRGLAAVEIRATA